MGTDTSAPVLDPGQPIDIFPSYFWVWVEAVREYFKAERNAVPLSSALDMYPIINRHYRPRQDSRKPNPSAYISYMKKAGLLRLFGEKRRDNFWVPETAITIRMSGKIVYTPSDLDDLLEGAVAFQSTEQTPGDSTEGEPEGEVLPPPRAIRWIHSEGKVKAQELHLALWEMATPTQDPLWRVLQKTTALRSAERMCGHRIAYVNLFAHALMKSGNEEGTCLLRSPDTPSKEMDQPPASQRPGGEGEVGGRQRKTAAGKGKSKAGRREVFEVLHRALWDGAQGSDGADRRLITKSEAKVVAHRVLGNATLVPHLVRYGRLLCGEDGCYFVTRPVEVEAEVPATPAQQMQQDATSLDLAGLQARLRELEAVYDSAALESQRDALSGRIGEAQAQASALRAQAQALDTQAAAFIQEREGLDQQVEALLMRQQQDQKILDLNWAIANFERFKRVHSTLVVLSPKKE
jgi:hypothetical protein